MGGVGPWKDSAAAEVQGDAALEAEYGKIISDSRRAGRLCYPNGHGKSGGFEGAVRKKSIGGRNSVAETQLPERLHADGGRQTLLERVEARTVKPTSWEKPGPRGAGIGLTGRKQLANPRSHVYLPSISGPRR